MSLQGLTLGEISELDEIYIADEELDGVLGRIQRDIRSGNNAKRATAYKALRRISTIKTKKNGASVKVREPETKFLTGKAKFERRLNLIPKGIRNDLVLGSKTTSDFSVYSIKLAEGNRVEMFESGDNKREGLTNVNRAMLPNGAVMLVESIQILSGVGAGATEEDGKIVDFDKIHEIIANGNFTFKNGQKIHFEDMSSAVFNHEGGSGVVKGIYKLNTPKMILPDTEIIFDIDMAGTLPANTFIKVIFNGIISVKA